MAKVAQYGVKHDAATLDSRRRRFDLPSSPLHNAQDARVTLELFYAHPMIWTLKQMCLKDLKAMTSAVKVY